MKGWKVVWKWDKELIIRIEILSKENLRQLKDKEDKSELTLIKYKVVIH